MPLFTCTPQGATPSYRALAAPENPRAAAANAQCESFWVDYQPFADPDFATRFPLETHALWFEMYLTVSLLRTGLPVQRPPRPGEGPDVLLEVGGQRIWIEATCATGGTPGSPNAVEPIVYAQPGEPPVVRDLQPDLIATRITNSLHGKQQAYRRYLDAGLVGPNDLAVIAINVSAVPHGYFDMVPLMLRALYGVGNPVLHLDRATGAVVARDHQIIASVPKCGTGAPVPMQSFADGSIPHISAVLASREDVWNVPGQLGAGTRWHPNLTATNPWPAGLLPVGAELQFTPEEDSWALSARSGSQPTVRAKRGFAHLRGHARISSRRAAWGSMSSAMRSLSAHLASSSTDPTRVDPDSRPGPSSAPGADSQRAPIGRDWSPPPPHPRQRCTVSTTGDFLGLYRTYRDYCALRFVSISYLYVR